MKANTVYKYPINSPSYRYIKVDPASYKKYPWKVVESTYTFSVTPTYQNNKFVEQTDSVSFDYKATASNPVYDGLVLEYLFYEGSGTVLHDTSGNGNHGTIYGTTWTQLSNGKWALYFDGVDDYVSIPKDLLNNLYEYNKNLPNYMTIEVIFKPLNKIWTIIGAVGNEPFTGATTNAPHIYSDVDGKIKLGSWMDTCHVLDTGIISSPTFFHIVGIFKHASNMDETIEAYVNGQFKGSSTVVTSGWQSVPYNYIGVLFTGSGCWNSNNKWDPLQGYIALVRIFNYALSSSEVSTLYNIAKKLIPG